MHQCMNVCVHGWMLACVVMDFEWLQRLEKDSCYGQYTLFQSRSFKMNSWCTSFKKKFFYKYSVLMLLQKIML